MEIIAMDGLMQPFVFTWISERALTIQMNQHILSDIHLESSLSTEEESLWHLQKEQFFLRLNWCGRVLCLLLQQRFIHKLLALDLRSAQWCGGAPLAPPEACKSNFASISYFLVITASWGNAEACLTGVLFISTSRRRTLDAGGADSGGVMRQLCASSHYLVLVLL